MNGGPKVPIKNPLLGALAELGLELLQDEIRHRCEQLEQEPIGHLFHAFQARRAQIRAEGREPTQDDFEQFLNEVPEIVARARAAKRGVPYDEE